MAFGPGTGKSRADRQAAISAARTEKKASRKAKRQWNKATVDPVAGTRTNNRRLNAREVTGGSAVGNALRSITCKNRSKSTKRKGTDYS